MANELKSVLEAIQSGTAWLEKRGVPEARRNMEHLLAHVLGLKRLELYLQFDRPLGEGELGPLRELLKRRGQREPLQHVLGTVDVAGRIFKTDKRALIPRPETEELAMFLLKKGPPAGGRVLDVGCGSGVLGLTLAAGWSGVPGLSVVLSDISPEALALAEENAAGLGLAAPLVRFVVSDLFAGLAGETFGLITANLPYIPSGELAALEAEVGWDPVLALDGGPDGLGILARFARDVAAHLVPGGRVALEVGSGQGQVVADMLAAAGLPGVRWLPDIAGVDRFVIAGGADEPAPVQDSPQQAPDTMPADGEPADPFITT